MTKVRKISFKIPPKQVDIFDIPESIIPADKRLFYPDWDNKPPERSNVITMQGKRVLTTGNLLAIVSKPGLGKSSLCEALIASILSPTCDSLGFTVKLTKPRDKVLYIDTEQSRADTWNSWARTYRRANVKPPTIDKRIIFVSYKAVSVLDRKQNVEKTLNDNQDIGVVIFDGAGDFIRDSNSIPESTEFIDWINSFNPRISVVVTLHTNPDTNKPRGHIGSELCRRSESVFLIKKIENGTREITTTFEYGKVRNDGDEISSFYKYSEDLQMFITEDDYIPKRAIVQEKEEKHAKCAQTIFAGRSELSADFIISQISELYKITEVAAKGVFYRHFHKKFVSNSGNGFKLQSSYN